MEQVFIVLQYRITDKKVETFINYFDERRIFQYDEYFLLDQTRIQRLFLKNAQHLASDLTIAATFLEEHQAKVVAMTIDGDFILANDNETFVVPKSFMLADLESYQQPLIDFFVAYEEQTLTSNTLPTFIPSEALDFTEDELIDQETTLEKPEAAADKPKKSFLSRFLK